MMRHLGILVTLLGFIVVGFESRLLVENELENLPAMDFKLHVGEDRIAVPCVDGGIRICDQSVKDEKLVRKILPFGLDEQRLSKSKASPAVGHMQIYSIANLGKTGQVGHQETDVSQKRILGSTPSPGAGH